MVLGGRVNQEIVRSINAKGGAAVGITGKDGNLAIARRLTSVGPDKIDPGRVAAWQASIRAAIRQAQLLSGRPRVCVIGLRLGATLAATVSVEAPVDFMVLWNPCVRMKSYLRELQAIALTAERGAGGIADGLESAGFVMSGETIAELRAIDLLDFAQQVKSRALVIGRDDSAPDHSLCEHLAAGGIATDALRLPGWAGGHARHRIPGFLPVQRHGVEVERE